ncbi:MAG: methyltransferase family protein [Candidatus Bathyarchaeia archaeon]
MKPNDSQWTRVTSGAAIIIAIYGALYLQLGWLGLAVWVLVFWVPVLAVRLTFWVPLHRWRRHRQKGRKALWRVVAGVWLTSLVLVAVSLPTLLSYVTEPPMWVKVGGFIALAGGIFVMLWTITVLGWRRLLALPVIDHSSETPNRGGLEVHGPYTVMRHPLYFSEVLQFLGVYMLSGVTSVLVLLATWLGVVFLITRVEERELMERLGDEYAAYCRRVGMFMPRWRRGGTNRN